MTPDSDAKEIAQHLIELETQALRRWGSGDPSGFLEISTDDVVYFDPFQTSRIDGLPALSAFYETLRGKIHMAHFDLVNPHVQIAGHAAVLSYNFVSQTTDGDTHRWNCSEVFRYDGGRWKLIQTHWSFTNPHNT